MNIRNIVLALAGGALMMAGCQKDNHIVPNTDNPFYGVYRPALQVEKVCLTVSTPNHVLRDSLPYISVLWQHGRVASVRYDLSDQIQNQVCNQYAYDDNMHISNIDSNIFFHYNDRKLLSDIRTVLHDRTRTLLFLYDGSTLPTKIIDSTFYRPSTDPAEWHAVRTTYRLTWRNGNLLEAIPEEANAPQYHYTYDTLPNLFRGFAWAQTFCHTGIFNWPAMFNRNNILSTVGTDTATGTRTTLYHYTYNGSRLTHFNKQCDDTTYTYWIKYRGNRQQ